MTSYSDNIKAAAEAAMEMNPNSKKLAEERQDDAIELLRNAGFEIGAHDIATATNCKVQIFPDGFSGLFGICLNVDGSNIYVNCDLADIDPDRITPPVIIDDCHSVDWQAGGPVKGTADRS